MKGIKNGNCNRTACQSPKNVEWYNHSTRKYYCSKCANILNNDRFNKADAQRIWGHDLCTKE
jgi:hypothetical protein